MRYSDFLLVSGTVTAFFGYILMAFTHNPIFFGIGIGGNMTQILGLIILVSRKK